MRVTSLAVALLLMGCDAREPSLQQFDVALNAQATDGQALAEVAFWADGRALGTTGVSGGLLARLEGHDGQRMTLSAVCPPGYRTLEAQRFFVLRTLRNQGTARLELQTRCEALQNTVALVVRTTGLRGATSFPVRVRGEVVGQTDPDGIAHLLLKARPRSALRATLDTSAAPALRPRDPVHTFEVGDADAVLVLEQVFEPQSVATARKRVVRVAPKLPYRIH